MTIAPELDKAPPAPKAAAPAPDRAPAGPTQAPSKTADAAFPAGGAANSPDNMLALQQTAGNQAVVGMVGSAAEFGGAPAAGAVAGSAIAGEPGAEIGGMLGTAGQAAAQFLKGTVGTLAGDSNEEAGGSERATGDSDKKTASKAPSTPKEPGGPLGAAAGGLGPAPAGPGETAGRLIGGTIAGSPGAAIGGTVGTAVGDAVALGQEVAGTLGMTGGAEASGAQVAGAEAAHAGGEAATGAAGAETAGAETAGAETAGAETAGAETGAGKAGEGPHAVTHPGPAAHGTTTSHGPGPAHETPAHETPAHAAANAGAEGAAGGAEAATAGTEAATAGAEGAAGAAEAAAAAGGTGGGEAVPTFPTAPGAVGAGPPPPPLPEIGGLAGADPLPDGPQVNEGHAAAIAGATEAAGGEQIEAAGRPIKTAEQTAAGAKPSGLLDTIIGLAKTAVKSLASGAVSLVEGIVGSVRSGVSSAATSVGSMAATAIRSAIGMAKSLGKVVMAGIHAVAEGAKSTARSAASAVLQHVVAAVKQLAGPLKSVVEAAFKPGGVLLFEQLTAVLHKAMFPMLDALPARISALSAKLQVALIMAATQVSGIVSSVTNFLTSNISAVEQALERDVSFVAERVRGVFRLVDGLLGRVPAVVRGAVSSVTGRILGLARTVLNAVESAAKTFIHTIERAVIATITSFADTVQAAIMLVYSLLSQAISRITARLLRAISAVQRFRNWLRAAIRSRVHRVLRAVSGWINAQTIKLVLKLIGPQIKAAVAQVKLMFPNGMPAPREVVDAASKAANQVSARDERDLLQGLLKPEGDHISFGLTFSGSAADVVGASGSVSANFDAVFDYRRNEIGFFVTPSVAAQGSAGVQGGAGVAGGIGMSWGTVGSFGKKSNDVEQAWGGWSTGAQYGEQASFMEGFGGTIASGGTVYRAGSVDTSITIPAIVVPGQTQPGTTVPGTPDRQEHIQLGEVLFPTGVSDVARALPPGRGAIDDAAQVVLTYPGGHPRGRVTRVYVMGEASPPWRHPQHGLTAAEENQDLSEQRARNVAAQLDPQLGGVKAEAHGVGSSEALKAGLKADAPAPERQRAVMTADAVISGTPAQTTPPTTGPGTQVTPAVTIPGSAPNPVASGRHAWGWDTSVSVAGGGGAEASAAGYAGLSASYAVPVGKTAMSPLAMGAIRIVVGLAKVFGDVVTSSPLAFIRDAVSLGVFGVEEVAGVSITKPILDWAIPMPGGTGGGGGG